ncbi:MAG: aspartate carbamoyltransferase regulatory subunit [Candidatus Acetothermia bacterium]|jgi:aspartate carbamoyltransferase regulatory subunit|nr:aspartate carbamoyltransferase regulatory subunit [Candidatus Acetothermia bacterium]
MLRVDSIQRGIVLDHIQPGTGFSIFERLGLREADYSVALLMNVPSTKMGRKDMIKIAEALDLDLTMLGLLDPNITVNYIEGGKVVRKVKLGLPERVEGILRCKNPRCITSAEPYAPAKFSLVDRDKKEYACFYCGERLQA